MIKNVLARLFFVYAMLLFVLSLIPVYLLLLLLQVFSTPAQLSRSAYYLFKVWMGLYLPLAGCRVKRKGKEHIEPHQQYVFIGNHSSVMDIPVCTPNLPGPNKTLAKNDFLKVPVFGLIYKTCSITIDRSSIKSRAESIGKMLSTLEQDFHLCLYPEGTRNKTDRPLLPFQDGAFKVAIQAQINIAPFIIRGTKHIVHPTKKFFVWPHAIEIEFLKPISTQGLTENDLGQLKQACFDVMLAAIEENKT